MQSVLIPVDGSACALRAVDLVLAKRARYRHPDELAIHLVNVQPPLPHAVTRFVSPQQVADYHRSESDRLSAEARARLDTAGAPYTYHPRVGSVADEIVALSTQLGCDQIVMGTHGWGEFMNLIMGRVAEGVLRKSDVPVMLLRYRDEESR